MKILHIITTALILLILPITQTLAAEKYLGNWSGALETPQGTLPLVLTITEDETGDLKAELESPAQAPGQKIPVTSITILDNHLSLVIRAIGASYEAEWVEAEDHWAGTFKQGMELQLIFTRGLPEAKPVFEGLDGVWEGSINRNNVDLRLILRIKTGDQGTVPTFDAPDFGAMGLPVAEFSRELKAVQFSVPAAAARFDGVLSDENTLTGTWTSTGQPDSEVTFIRTRKTTDRKDPERPQTPQEPFGYSVEEVSFENPDAEGVKLAGTLTLPEGKGPFPVAILISGSGPQDRDESFMGHKPFSVLADYLSRNGIAVLRYDDRGVGASTGDFSAATSADFATDANAAVNYLKTRAEIKGDSIGLVGHSEGGLIAPISAVMNKEINFIVMLAGPGTNLDHLVLSQRRLMGASQGVSKEELDKTEPTIVKILSEVKSSSSQADAVAKVNAILTPELLTEMGVPEERKDLIVRTFTSPWYLYFLKHKPAAFISKLEIPVLAINGALDQQVPPDENLSAIRAALVNNPDATVLELEGLNHLFQTAKTGALGEYFDIPETFAPSALELVADWINARF